MCSIILPIAILISVTILTVRVITIIVIRVSCYISLYRVPYVYRAMCVYIYIYIYVHIYTYMFYMYVYIYIYREREIERERERHSDIDRYACTHTCACVRECTRSLPGRSAPRGRSRFNEVVIIIVI